jgi:hypothetical protein
VQCGIAAETGSRVILAVSDGFREPDPFFLINKDGYLPRNRPMITWLGVDKEQIPPMGCEILIQQVEPGYGILFL